MVTLLSRCEFCREAVKIELAHGTQINLTAAEGRRIKVTCPHCRSTYSIDLSTRRIRESNARKRSRLLSSAENARKVAKMREAKQDQAPHYFSATTPDADGIKYSRAGDLISAAEQWSSADHLMREAALVGKKRDAHIGDPGYEDRQNKIAAYRAAALIFEELAEDQELRAATSTREPAHLDDHRATYDAARHLWYRAEETSKRAGDFYIAEGHRLRMLVAQVRAHRQLGQREGSDSALWQQGAAQTLDHIHAAARAAREAGDIESAEAWEIAAELAPLLPLDLPAEPTIEDHP